MFIKHNDCHVVGATLCCISLRFSASSEWALGNGCVVSRMLVWLLSVEGQGFREPQKFCRPVPKSAQPKPAGWGQSGSGHGGSSKERGKREEAAARYCQGQLETCLCDTGD